MTAIIDKPRVSVIMPVHNAGAYLQAAVESILAQTCPDFELILVDDHSNDGAVEKLSVSDSRFIRLASRQRGVVAAMRTGFEYARGDFIARMDADDISLPSRLQVQLDYLQLNPGIGLAGAQVEIFTGGALDGGLQRYQHWLNSLRQPEDIQREIFIESPIPNPGVMFRREVYQQLNGYQDPAWPEDYDMWLRANELGIRMGKPGNILLRWRDHGRRLTHTDERYSMRNFMKAKAHYLSRQLVNEKILIWGTGPNGVLFHDLLREHGIEITGFIDIHPRRIGGSKRELPVYAIDVIEKLNNEIIIGAVGSWGAREKMREYLDDRGWQEGQAYFFVN